MSNTLLRWTALRSWRLPSFVIICSAVPLLLFLYFGDHMLRKAAIDNLSRQTVGAADTVTQITEERLATARASVQSLAAEPDLEDAWKHRDTGRLFIHLREAHDLVPVVAFWALYNKDGFLKAEYPQSIQGEGRNFAAAGWFQNVMRQRAVYISGAIPFGRSHELGITVAAPVGYGQPDGVLTATYTLQTIKTWLAALPHSATSWISIVDPNGFMIVPPDLDPSARPHDASALEEVKKLLGGHSGTEFVRQGAEQVLVTSHPFPSWRGGVLVQIPATEIAKDFWKLERPIALVGALFAIFTLIVGSALAWLYLRLKASQQEIAHLNAELERRISDLTARNAALEAFSYSVSHDVRAPLRHMEGFTQLLSYECGRQLSATGREYLAQVQNATKHMHRLVDDLLRFARLGELGLKLQKTDLGELVREVMTSLQRDFGNRKVKLELADLPTVTCDRALIRQVFWNLLSNAVKFTAIRDEAFISVGQYRQDDQVVLFVRDNGVGFDMKYADKLFAPFQRLHTQEEFEGTGVGLALVQRIIFKHGGKIWAEAEPGHGASFFFTLRLDRAARSELLPGLQPQQC